MKNLKYITIFLMVLFTACKRETLPTIPSSALNVINASADQGSVYVNTFGSPIIYSRFAQLYGHSQQVYSLAPGNNNISVIAVTDTLHPFYNQDINVVKGGIYSLYVYGTAAQYQATVIKDNIPAVQDSSAGVRFINLSPDSQPVTVNIQGSSNAEFTSLAFKQISNFKMYSAKTNVGGVYNFEVRDAASGALLTTYSWYFKPFFCQTLVISGLQSDGSFNLFSVNNF